MEVLVCFGSDSLHGVNHGDVEFLGGVAHFNLRICLRLYIHIGSVLCLGVISQFVAFLSN